MTAGIADPLRMAIFGCMNGEKANNSLRADCNIRGVVSVLQMKNSASGVLEMAHGKNGAIANCLNTMSDGIHTARNTSKVFDGVCKGINILSDLINPILVVASGVRVYKSDDKKSAILKELGAMSFMFAGEEIFKRLFGLGGKTACYKKYGFIKSAITSCKNICNKIPMLNKIPANRLSGIAKALGFIATSCLSFDLGGKIGKKIAEKTTAKEYSEKHAKTHNVEYDA